MSAVFSRNELVAAKRRALVVVYLSDGVTMAPRSTSFTSKLFVGQSSSTLVAASGTMTNVRRPLVVADSTVSSITAGTDTITTSSAHNLETGDGPIRVTTTGSLTGTGLALATDYWIVKVDGTNIKLATSLSNAYAGTVVDLTGSGTGTHTIDVTASTQRGLDGYWIYEATQLETDFDGSEFLITVAGDSTLVQSVTTVNMNPLATFKGFETVSEGSYTYGDIMRLITGVLTGKASNYTTGTLTFKSLDGSKTRVTVTVDATGRLTVTIGDLT